MISKMKSAIMRTYNMRKAFYILSIPVFLLIIVCYALIADTVDKQLAETYTSSGVQGVVVHAVNKQLPSDTQFAIKAFQKRVRSTVLAAVDVGTEHISDSTNFTTGRLETELSNEYSTNDLDTAPSKLSGPQPVLLLTYMRSGSSVTGEILQYSKDMFYVFEPLRVLFNYIIKNNHPLRFVNGTVLRPGSYNSTDVLKEALKGWFTCNFSTIYQLSFKDYVFLNLSSKARNFVSCLNTDGVHKSVLFADCLEKFETICRESKFVVVKTIRTSMKVAQELMELIPNLKVIHLVRDARQTAMSQARREECGLKGIVNCAKSLCKVATEDDEVKTTMGKRYRVLTVRYEEVATMPVNATRAMYNFVGLAFTKEVESYVTRITTGGNHSECEACKLKWQMGNLSQSSVVHIDTWKKEMRPSVIVSVQLLCEKYLTRYGYKLLKLNYSEIK